MADSNYTGALLAGLAWLPWSEDPSGDCPTVIVQFFRSLGIDPAMALSRSSQKEELSQWLKSHFGHSRQKKVCWFKVGIRTMVLSNMLASGAAPEIAEAAMTAYRSVLEEAGVPLKARDRITALLHEMGRAPLDQQIFARLLEALEEQARPHSASPLLKPRSNPFATTSYCLTVALVITMALAGFSKNVSPFVLPSILVAGLLLTTAIGGFGAFRD